MDVVADRNLWKVTGNLVLIETQDGLLDDIRSGVNTDFVDGKGRRKSDDVVVPLLEQGHRQESGKLQISCSHYDITPMGSVTYEVRQHSRCDDWAGW